MKGKVCLITGSNRGIGKATALRLAQMGATVVMVCRDKSRGEAALAEIKATSSNPSVDLLLADLSSQAAIRRLAQDFRERYQHLHVLVNNAGVFRSKRSVTADGVETTFAVGYLARFLLTNLLLDVLKASAPARVVNVAGASHRKAAIDFDDLMWEKNYGGFRAAGQTQLANVHFTYELARRLEGTGVTANCLHPGAVATDLEESDPDLPPLSRFIYRLVKPFFKSPEKGAETVVYLASSPEVEGVSGKYFINKAEIKSSAESYDLSVAERLWAVSAELTSFWT